MSTKSLIKRAFTGSKTFHGTLKMSSQHSGERRMEYYCINKEHKNRLTDLMQADGTNRGDMERISLFYIITGNESLYNRRNSIYNVKEHCIKNCIEDEKEDFSSGLRSLIKLGFNLYNGYKGDNMTPIDLFWNLDHKNRHLAENAIRLRFNSESLYEKDNHNLKGNDMHSVINKIHANTYVEN